MPTRNVVLTDRQETLIEALVQSGRLRSSSRRRRGRMAFTTEQLRTFGGTDLGGHGRATIAR
jgi:hypothetical protein